MKKWLALNLLVLSFSASAFAQAGLYLKNCVGENFSVKIYGDWSEPSLLFANFGKPYKTFELSMVLPKDTVLSKPVVRTVERGASHLAVVEYVSGKPNDRGILPVSVRVMNTRLNQVLEDNIACKTMHTAEAGANEVTFKK